MLYQECCRAVFWAYYCSSCTCQRFFAYWKIGWLVMLMTVLPSPLIRVAVAEFPIHDLVRVSEWCDVWGMKLYVSKIAQCIPSHPHLTIGRTTLKESEDLYILGVTFDSKIIFEKHLRWVSRAASQRLGILRKSWRVFHDRYLFMRCFWVFFLPVLEYYSAVWCSAASTHLKLMNPAVSGARFLTGVCLSVTLLVDPWQSCVCCTRLDVIRCTLLMALYLDRICQCRLQSGLWSPISTLTHHLAAEPRCTEGLFFYSPLSVSLEQSC